MLPNFSLCEPALGAQSPCLSQTGSMEKGCMSMSVYDGIVGATQGPE